MEFIRIINLRFWDSRKQRFNRYAFFNTGEPPGISVVRVDCIQSTGTCICGHIGSYYEEKITGSPPAYWRFDVKLLPPQAKFRQETSDRGDTCHYVIENLTPKDARDFFIEHTKTLDPFRICAPEEDRPLVAADLALSNI